MAFGIHARAIKSFSFKVKPAHNTHTKVKRIRTTRAMNREAIPKPREQIEKSYTYILTVNGVRYMSWYTFKRLVSKLFLQHFLSEVQVLSTASTSDVT